MEGKKPSWWVFFGRLKTYKVVKCVLGGRGGRRPGKVRLMRDPLLVFIGEMM